MSIDTTKKIKQVTYNGTEIPLNGYDTSDATVTADDMLAGKIAYGSSGKVTGNMKNLTQVIMSNPPLAVHQGSGEIVGAAKSPSVGYINTDTTLGFRLAADNFGNAATSDVVKGKTFTSQAGLKMTGTYVPLDTSDATATAADITLGKTAYVNGRLVTGTREDSAVANIYNNTTKTLLCLLNTGDSIESVELAPDVGTDYVPLKSGSMVVAKDPSGALETIEVINGAEEPWGSSEYSFNHGCAFLLDPVAVMEGDNTIILNEP